MRSLTLCLVLSTPSSSLSTLPTTFAAGLEDVLGRLADAILEAISLPQPFKSHTLDAPISTKILSDSIDATLWGDRARSPPEAKETFRIVKELL